MKSELPLFDALASRDARDRGIERVSIAADQFMDEAIKSVRELRRRLDGVFLAEDIRRELIDMGIKPHSPHAWGALTRTLISMRLIERTGQWVPMRDKRSHARLTPQYQWIVWVRYDGSEWRKQP
jgi:hypothetical protein